MVWLFYSAPLLCRQLSPWYFYTPRIVYVLIIFTLSVIVIIYQYGFLISMSDAKVYSNVGNWSALDESISYNTFYIIQMIQHVLGWLYYIIWICQMFYTRYQLSKLSYMQNRYLHLSFRYFTLQGSLLIIFYIIRFIFVDADMFLEGLTSLEDAFYNSELGYLNINVDFVFQTVYCVILAYVFAPINQLTEKEELELNMLTSYVITEEEYSEKVKIRQGLLQQLNEFQKLMKHQIYICCIDRALELCRASYEVYFDQPGQHTAGGAGHDVDDMKDMDLESMGYKFIALHNDEESDTFCCIGRHKLSRKLLIVYRGTSSMKNWKTNSNYTQTNFLLSDESPNIPFPDIFDRESENHIIRRSSDDQPNHNRNNHNNNEEEEDKDKHSRRNLYETF